MDANEERSKTEPTPGAVRLQLAPVDQRACDLLLNEPRKETHITVISGDQSGRIASDFRDSGFQNVDAFKEGFFEDWVHREAGVGTRHSN